MGHNGREVSWFGGNSRVIIWWFDNSRGGTPSIARVIGREPMPSLSSLQQTIGRVFASVGYPGDDNITRCPYDCTECRQIARFFQGKSCDQLAVEDLRRHHTALALFTPEAFQYFLPAFMLASLDSHEKGDVIPDAIRFYFEYSGEIKGHFPVRLSRFSPGQRETIIDYLSYLEEKGAGSSGDAIAVLKEETEYA